MLGFDFLGAGAYPKKAAKYLPNGYAFGCFTYPKSAEGKPMFEDGLKAVRMVAATGKAPLIRCNILWSDLQPHKFGHHLLPIIEAESKRINEIAAQYPDIDFEIVPITEHNESDPDTYLQVVKKAAPLCTPVNSIHHGALSRKFKNEIHGPGGPLKGKYNYSFDGSNMFDDDIEAVRAAHKSAEVFFFWYPQCNGRGAAGDPTPRPNRKCYPHPEVQESAMWVIDNKKGKSDLPAKWLWKSHADQHSNPPEPRACKPVLLAPIGDKNTVEIIDRAGKVVGKGIFAGFFKGDGRAMYRFTEYGYVTMQKVLKYQRARVLRLRVDGKVIGRVNAAFRENEYRM